MKRIVSGALLPLAMGMIWSCAPQGGGAGEQHAEASPKYKHSIEAPRDERVEALLAKMTIEEKVGQMTQVNQNLILEGGYGNTDGSINEDQLKEAVSGYKVGSILNAVPGAHSVEDWHRIIKAIQDVALNETPNKIPVLYGIDAIHGATFTKNSTLFPHNIGLSATRDAELVKQGAKVAAKEVRASAIRWNFDPVFDIGRQPLWPRFPETFGEDVHLVKTMGVATVLGYEEDGLNSPTGVASCMKHFVGYSAPASGKDRTPSYIPERQLREFYLPQFKAAVEAGSSTIMINSGEVNGIPVHANYHLLTEVLRGEFGFEGLIVTDWEDIMRLELRHKVAKDQKEAVKMGIMAGIDMSMVPHDYKFADYLIELVKEGSVPEERLNESCRRILKLKFDLGLFDNPYAEEEATANFGKPEYTEMALKTAEETMTLLKNEGNVLPLNKSSKVLVAGPGANNIAALSGCWSYTWQGADISKYPETTIPVQQAIINKIGAENVVTMSVPEYENAANYDVETLKKKAAGVDYIVLCIGENAYAESPGVIDDLTLDGRQLKLAQAAIQTGKPVIAVLIEGRPRVLSSVEPGFKGVLMAYWPGSRGADAIANTLFGDNNPSGRLPYTYHKYTGDIVTYDHKLSDVYQELAPGVIDTDAHQPQWAFGHGLSYSTFSYGDIQLSSAELTGSGKVTVSIDVTNTSDVDGEEAVDLFTHDVTASVTPSLRRLRAFTKVALKAGETKTVSFDLTADDLKFVGRDMKWVTEPGAFEVMIADKKAGFTYKD